MVDNFRSDIDECELEQNCTHNCHNTYGSYECTCNDGFELLSDGYKCQGNSSKILKKYYCAVS